MSSGETTALEPHALSLPAQLGLLVGPFLSMVDSNAVNVALVPMTQALHGSLHDGQWIVSAYLLSLSAALSATAYLSKRIGTLRAYRMSLVGFLLGSLLCALSPTLSLLIAARVVQGAFGAPLIPLAMTMLLGGEGHLAKGRMSPLLGIVLFMGPAIGPSVGGLLIEAGGWPLIFLINIPLGIAGILAAARVRPSAAEVADKSAPLDLAGILLLSLGLVGVTYGATNGPTEGWLSVRSVPFWAAGAACLLLYGVLAARKAHPAVNLSLLRARFTGSALAIATLTAIVNFAMVVLVPLFMQNLQRHPPLTAGLALIPQALMSGVGTALSGRVTRRLGIRWTTITGMVLLTAGTLVLLLAQIGTPPWVMACILIARSFAIGLVVQPLLEAAVGRTPAALSADANTLFMITNRVAGAVGIAVLVTFFQVRSQALASVRGVAGAVEGFHQTVLVLTGCAALGLLVAVFTLRGDRTSSPGARP